MLPAALAAFTARRVGAPLGAILLLGALCTCGDAPSSSSSLATPHLTCPEVVDRTQCSADAKFRIHIKLDFAVQDGQVEVVTQSGPYRFPVGYLDGKTFLYLFVAKGEVFQGELRDALDIGAGTMHGNVGELTTAAKFPAGEYEFVTFIDANPGPQPITGPERGDLAAFDNNVCDPTGVSVRVAVPCEDADVTLGNQQFIIF
ncbi:MAG TPA: hypothetical protein VEI94_12745 [Candidatus Bathyarchaeia archaeon]|nr:hypothetical protein [Candidatus Bathyarchaeia archaeon]